MVYKTNESIIVIQAEATSPNRTNVVFWSHDRGTAKLRMKLVRKNGIPQSLPEGTTVPIRLMFRSATAEGGYGKHDYLATIEDRVNGIVSIVLEDNILGYVGIVEGSVYIDFPNDQSLDTAGRFTFDIKRSPIDDSTPELEDYYFNGFSQTIDKVEKIISDAKTEIDEKVAESETQIDTKLKETNDKVTKANQDVATLNTNIDKANDRIDQTNQQISDLGKLKKMYANSIDFGDYDYSGNPNLMPVLKAKDFSPNSQITIEDSGNSLKVTFADSEGAKFLTSIKSVPALLPGTQYTLSADVTVLEGYKGDLNSLRLAYRKTPGGTALLAATAKNAQVGKKKKIYATANSSAATDPSIFDRMYFTIDTNFTNPFVGTVLIENIKVERGSIATPYQPNLLDDPYWLGKTPLGDNLMTGTFPVSNSQYAILGRVLKKNLEIGKTYTATLKGTKPTTQTFAAYSGGTVKFGDFKPVEGLTDVWSVTFTVSNLSNSPANFTLYQQPQATIGACQIDWLKIEKGDTRTPNISQFKYFGEGLKDSTNPNDYSWDIIPEYAEKSLKNTVSLTEPQTVLGLKNFSDGIQIAGDRVVGENEHVVYTLDASNSKSFIDGYATFIKHGKEVIVNGTVKFKKAYPFGTTLEDVLPDEFVAKIVHGMLIGSAGSNNIAKILYIQKDTGTIRTNSDFAINEWFTFNGSYWVGEE
ncbi:BppU family phage baseplate upper protein [Enterococcus faecium]|uniref:BppU family phage baseplate upper protein n=1 Tax=Enterococcus faecium TaxID=1352 RepID=UPI002660030E|nr:BppU family phage baseplate upper protein [Enterococcus faecium]MDO1598648.1 BppU family phage baseplate upper protein [Enterococcus faecium]